MGQVKSNCGGGFSIRFSFRFYLRVSCLGLGLGPVLLIPLKEIAQKLVFRRLLDRRKVFVGVGLAFGLDLGFTLGLASNPRVRVRVSDSSFTLFFRISEIVPTFGSNFSVFILMPPLSVGYH